MADSSPSEQNTLPPASVPPELADATLPPPMGLANDLLRPGRPALPLQLGRYRLDQQLGQGGMGAVYRAHDSHLGRTVALKIPFLSGHSTETVRARFLREAQSAAVLAHPNICPVHDLGEIDGVPYLTMAFIQGGSLAKKIDPEHPLPPREAAALTRKIALALHVAHENGVIHRDLKPANIMIDERGEPVVMDFGLARRADAQLLLTQQGEMMGTPAYMPPEQVNGDIQAMGPASDVYSLGAMLYELVVGRPPFHGDILSILSQICIDEPPAPSRLRPGLNPAIDYLCLKALKKSPVERWASMSALADALGRFLAAGAPCDTSFAAPPFTLKVLGSPFAYRPAPGQKIITLGRQKRKPGEPPEQGNDVVLRVPNNDALSARISRRHLEIHCADEKLFVVDRSKAGTLHNGQSLVRDAATPLAAGDHLLVAGVLTLQIVAGAASAASAVAEARVAASAGGHVVLEASLGDMVTME